MPNTLSGSGNELPPNRSASGGVHGGQFAQQSWGRLHLILQWTRRAASKLGGGTALPAGSIAALTRAEPLLSPSDTLAAAHAALRRSPNSALCVGVAGHVLGALSLEALNQVLGANLKYLGGPEFGPSLNPLSALLDGPEPLLILDAAPVLRFSDPLDRAQSALSVAAHSPLVVVCADGARPVYLGVVYRSDVVAAALGNLAPVRVGGMATPLGVYLTDGVVQGGAGNLGLVLAGASMSLLFAAALAVSGVVLNWLQAALHVNLMQALSLAFLRLSGNSIVTLTADLQVTLALPLLLIFLRLVPVSGIHAAEHQVVHCLERGEPLVPENVRRMPRVHPRCGTNLMMALTILTLSLSVGFGLTGSVADSVLPAAIVTLLSWRSVGSAVQQFLTTRPASDKQIASGIRAGQEVMRRSLESGLETRPTLAQRVWNMGLVQLMLGAYLVSGLLGLLVTLFPAFGNYFNGLY